MILDTFKFAFKGLSFEYATKTKEKDLIKKLKKLTVVKASLPKSNGVVARVSGRNATLFRLRMPLIHTGKPVLYVTIDTVEGRTEVRGAFTFTVLARAVFWLALLFSVSIFALETFRLFYAIFKAAELLYLTGVALQLLIGPLVAYATFVWYHWTWMQCNSDMQEIAESLKKISR